MKKGGCWQELPSWKDGSEWFYQHKLQFYHGLHKLFMKHYKEAGRLLAQAVSTAMVYRFTATELLPSEDLVVLTMMINTFMLQSSAHKKKVSLTLWCILVLTSPR